MFSKKPDETPVPSQRARSMGSGNSTFSVIGSDVTITGNIQASVDLHVDGRVDGDITCASLVQGETSEIEGAVEAESARLAGRVDGSVSVRELVVLRTAKIHGDVNYDSLTIEQGAEVEGKLAHRLPGQQPATAKPATKPKGDAPALPLKDSQAVSEPKLTIAT